MRRGTVRTTKAVNVPPYRNISPEAARAELGAPVGTAGLAAIAEDCRQGRENPAGRDDSGGGRRLRRFSTWEITRYLIPVARAHLRRVLRQSPELPQGQAETPGGARWFTLDEVLQLRAHFAAEGSKAKGYLPYRPEGLPAKTVCLANCRSGVGKTSTAAHLAMAAALDGYRVLVVDLDGQGSMTGTFGARVEDEWGTVFPLLARHYARHLRIENQRRIDRGEAPVPFDDTLTKALKLTAGDLIRPTHWPNIDLIGAQLDLYRAELRIPAWRMASPGWKPWDALAGSLAEDGVLGRYDLVFLDTPPALGYLAINGLAAADILLVPLGASFVEFDSTGRFFDMLHAAFASIEASENLAARALGRPELRFEWDAVRAVITRYDGAQQAETGGLIATSLGRTLSPHRQDFSALIGQAGEASAGIYETDYRDFNRETYARARATFDETYAAFKRLLIGIWHREAEAAGLAPVSPDPQAVATPLTA